MESKMKSLILFGALAVFYSSPSLAQENGPFDQTCTYQNLSEPPEDAADEVLCTMRYSASSTGLIYKFRFGGRTVQIKTIDGYVNGLWTIVEIDGKRGLMFELWRGSRIAATNDGSISFEWRDPGSPKFPRN